jgi:hypothetical protein
MDNGHNDRYRENSSSIMCLGHFGAMLDCDSFSPYEPHPDKEKVGSSQSTAELSRLPSNLVNEER